MELLAPSYMNSYDLTSKKTWLPEITFTTDYELMLLEEFTHIDNVDEVVLALLQSFNKHIISVDIKGWKYTVDMGTKLRTLPIFRLSRVEKVFLLCLMADKLRKPVYICHDMRQLSKSNLIRFVAEFSHSAFIHVVVPDGMLYFIMKEL